MTRAVREQLRGTGHNAGLKWPNDVLLDGGKLCGILAEVVPARSRRRRHRRRASTPGCRAPTFRSRRPPRSRPSGSRPTTTGCSPTSSPRSTSSSPRSPAAGGDAAASGVLAEVEALCTTIGSDVVGLAARRRGARGPRAAASTPRAASSSSRTASSRARSRRATSSTSADRVAAPCRRDGVGTAVRGARRRSRAQWEHDAADDLRRAAAHAGAGCADARAAGRAVPRARAAAVLVGARAHRRGGRLRLVLRQPARAARELDAARRGGRRGVPARRCSRSSRGGRTSTRSRRAA